MISILIPVHNAAAHVERTVGSALAQTHRDIEVVVVDDASTDGTALVVEGLQQADDRLRLVRLTDNVERFEARRRAVEEAHGDHLLFVDGDDYLDADFVERLVRDVEANGPADIVQTAIACDYDDPPSAEERQAYQDCLAPCAGVAVGSDVVHTIFRDGKAPWSVFAKLMSTELVRRAYALLPHARLVQAEDAVLIFVACTLATSWRGVPGIDGYHYQVQTGSSHDFAAKRQAGRSAATLRAYLEQAGMQERYAADFARLETFLSDETFESMLEDGEGTLEGRLARALECWDAAPLAAAAYRMVSWNREERCELLMRLGETDYPIRSKQVRKIAFYHWRIGLGGVESVIEALVAQFRSQGIEILLVTDEGASIGEPPEGTSWVEIPPFDGCGPELFPARGRALEAALADFEPDLFVYHQWCGTTLPFDVLLAKMMGIATVIFAHTAFQHLLRVPEPRFSLLPLAYRIADGVVCLSELDRVFWRRSNDNVWVTFNKVAWRTEDVTRPSFGGRDVVWLGRLDPSLKRPDRSLHIMRRVVEEVPDARLLLVGPVDEGYERELRALAAELGLGEGSVVFCGPTDDAKGYFQRAQVHLVTSEYEGYCLVVGESLTCGLPSVMFDCPTTPFSLDPKGTVVVSQDDVETASRAVVRLLTDEAYWQQQSDLAFERARELEDFDLVAQWEEIFDVALRAHHRPLPRYEREEQVLYWRERLEAQERARGEVADRDRELGELRGARGALEHDLACVTGSVSFRAGRALTAPLRLARDLVARRHDS